MWVLAELEVRALPPSRPAPFVPAGSYIVQTFRSVFTHKGGGPDRVHVCLCVCLSVGLKPRSCLPKKAQDPGPQRFRKKYYDLGTFLLIIFYYGTSGNSLSKCLKKFPKECQ